MKYSVLQILTCSLLRLAIGEINSVLFLYTEVGHLDTNTDHASAF